MTFLPEFITTYILFSKCTYMIALARVHYEHIKHLYVHITIFLNWPDNNSSHLYIMFIVVVHKHKWECIALQHMCAMVDILKLFMGRRRQLVLYESKVEFKIIFYDILLIVLSVSSFILQYRRHCKCLSRIRHAANLNCQILILKFKCYPFSCRCSSRKNESGY